MNFLHRSYCRQTTRRTPLAWDFSLALPLHLGGLQDEGEFDQLLFTPCRLTKIENVVQDGQWIVAIIATNALHVLTFSFFIYSFISLGTCLANFLESFRFLQRVAWTVLATSHRPERDPDSLPSVILHFCTGIGDGSLCVEVPMVRCCCRRRFPLLNIFSNCSHLHSL